MNNYKWQIRDLFQHSITISDILMHVVWQYSSQKFIFDFTISVMLWPQTWKNFIIIVLYAKNNLMEVAINSYNDFN